MVGREATMNVEATSDEATNGRTEVSKMSVEKLERKHEM
jgi:hypothetical protein